MLAVLPSDSIVIEPYCPFKSHSRKSIEGLAARRRQSMGGYVGKRAKVGKTGAVSMRVGGGPVRPTSLERKEMWPRQRQSVLPLAFALQEGQISQFGNVPRLHQRALAVDIPDPFSQRCAATWHAGHDKRAARRKRTRPLSNGASAM